MMEVVESQPRSDLTMEYRALVEPYDALLAKAMTDENSHAYLRGTVAQNAGFKIELTKEQMPLVKALSHQADVELCEALNSGGWVSANSLPEAVSSKPWAVSDLSQKDYPKWGDLDQRFNFRDILHILEMNEGKLTARLATAVTLDTRKRATTGARHELDDEILARKMRVMERDMEIVQKAIDQKTAKQDRSTQTMSESSKSLTQKKDAGLLEKARARLAKLFPKK